MIENLVIILYLGLLGYLGFYGYKSTKDSTDYLLAGRDTHPFIMALSYGATFISTSAIIGFGGVAAWLGNSMLWLTFFTIFVGVFISFVVFGNPTRQMGYRLNAHTFPELLGKRYDSRFMQVCGGALILLFMPLYAAAVLIGGSHFIAGYFEVNYHTALLVFSIIVTAYVLAGGLKGVMLTDALQGSLMFIAMILLLVFTYQSLGGVGAAHEKMELAWQGTVADPLADQSLKTLAAGGPDFMMKLSQVWGFNGWNSMPEFLSRGWLYLITTLVMGVGIGVLAQPQLIVRFMTVKSKKELNRAVLIGAIFILAMTGIIFLVGAMSNAWYYEFNDGKNALQSAGSVGKVIPHFIQNAMPHWFSFIFLIALISAGMSTLSSQFHAMGTAVGRDIFEQLFGSEGKNSVTITRIGILVTISFSVALAYAFEQQPAIIARSTAIFFALCAAVFLPAYMGGLFWRRMTRAGAISSMLVGFLVSGFWLLFVHFKEAKALGVAKALFGNDSLLNGKVIFVDALAIALPASLLTALIVSLLTAPLCNKTLERAFGR